jgi:hypothetical protein
MLITRKRALTVAMLGAIGIAFLGGAKACPGDSSSTTTSTPAPASTPHRATQPAKPPAKPTFPADIYPSNQAAADAAKAKHPTALCTTGWLSFDPNKYEACRPHHGTVAEWYGGQPA